MIRFLSTIEPDGVFGSGFSVSSENQWYRRALILKSKRTQQRVGGRPPQDIGLMARFPESVNRWLPTKRHRLLWVDHWAADYPSVHSTFEAARRGLGETRSLSEVPGQCFDPFPYDEQDQLAIAPEHATQVGVLVGLMSLLMIDQWDGWLVTENCTDRVEFWEGNIFFHSDDPLRIAAAEELLSTFACSRQVR